MSDDILNEYGRDSSAPQKPRATNGGHMPVSPIPYCPPTGPSNINDPQKPGLNGTNHGTCGTQGRH
jgi:hypothetical protein